MTDVALSAVVLKISVPSRAFAAAAVAAAAVDGVAVGDVL